MKNFRKLIIEQIQDEKLERFRQDLVQLFVKHRNIVTKQPEARGGPRVNLDQELDVLRKKHNLEEIPENKFGIFALGTLTGKDGKPIIDYQLFTFMKNALTKDKCLQSRYGDSLDSYEMSTFPSDVNGSIYDRKDPDPGFMRSPKVDTEEDLSNATTDYRRYRAN
jgi:hypothetical protein